jgi:hypothetical protein
MALAPQGKQTMSKGKIKAAKGGAGGGPSTKAAAAAGSSGQGSSRPSAPPARISGFHTEEEDAVQAALPLAAEAAGAAQQTEPAPAGGAKKDKERQRKERQRQRKVDVAMQAVQWAMEAMAQHGVRCVHSHVSPPSKSR